LRFGVKTVGIVIQPKLSATKAEHLSDWSEQMTPLLSETDAKWFDYHQRWQDWRDNYEDLARQLSNAGFSLKIAIEQRQSATIHSVVNEIDTIADDIVDAVALLPKEPDGC
jgi:hypothetical protein